MEEIKQELLELKSNGAKVVLLNGFFEKINYVMQLLNLKKVGNGVYLTNN